MDISTNVYGIVDISDEALKKIKTVIVNCHDLDIDVPDQIRERLRELGLNEECFDNDDEIIVKISSREYNADMEDGLEIDIEDIPDNVKIIRFVNTY